MSEGARLMQQEPDEELAEIRRRSVKSQPNRILSAMHPGDVRLFDPPEALRGLLDTGAGLSAEQVAAELGVTHQAVSQLTRKGLHKLRAGLVKIDAEMGGILQDPRFPKMFYQAMQELYHERYSKK